MGTASLLAIQQQHANQLEGGLELVIWFGQDR